VQSRKTGGPEDVMALTNYVQRKFSCVEPESPLWVRKSERPPNGGLYGSVLIVSAGRRSG